MNTTCYYDGCDRSGAYRVQHVTRMITEYACTLHLESVARHIGSAGDVLVVIRL